MRIRLSRPGRPACCDSYGIQEKVSMISRSPSRREFLQLGAASTITLAASPAFAFESRQVSPNDRIRLACIGIGSMGTGDTLTALKVNGVEMVAAADVYDGRFTAAKAQFGPALFTTRDYREILARPDIDAVIIATPDHWHMQQAIDSVAAGKAVYLEKPMVRTAEEGHRLIEAWKKSGKPVQVGSQFASSVIFQKAAELLKSGAIGELNLVEAFWNRNSPLGAWQYPIPEDASPQNVDWDRFLGQAPKVPFEPMRLFRWRNYRDYGTGMPGDLFVHLFTQLHVVTGALGPTRVSAMGGLRYWHDGRDVPDVQVAMYLYPKTAQHPEFNLTLKCNFADGGTQSEGAESAFRFNGPDGIMQASPRSVKISRRPAGAPEELRRQADEAYLPPDDYDDRLDHFRNFFAAMRGEAQVVEDPIVGLRAAGPALMTNVSHWEGRTSGWDPTIMKGIST
jgi:predicted dehydrogenase